MSFEIVVAQPVHTPVLELLGSHGRVVMNAGPEPWTSDELLARCRNAHALMAFMTERIDEDFVASCPNLKIIAGALKGYNNIDVEACARRSIAVTIVPDLLSEPTAELAVGLMIAAARNFGPGDRYIRQGQFDGWRPHLYGSSVNGSTVAVIGAGSVGEAILRMLRGFDCRRVYVDKRPLPPVTETRLDCQRMSLGEALGEADFVVLALHVMPSTFHLADAAFLAVMKPGSYLINPARGSLVDESAVALALESGHLAGYAADTFEMEDWSRTDRPKTVTEGLLESDRTILTPHLGSAVTSVRQEIERSAAESIIAMVRGEWPQSAVNRDCVPAV